MSSEKVKFAVVGTGPAGLGVLSALVKIKNVEITVFEAGDEVNPVPFEKEATKQNVAEYYKNIYNESYSNFPRKFPPPKTHFAKELTKFNIGDKPSIFKSRKLGGLSNYWGGTALPFTDRELKNWHISAKDLKPYYEELSEKIGIAGKDDELNEYFEEGFTNRPEVHVTNILKKLNGIEKRDKSPYKILTGSNRCMIETRPNLERSCIACGECMSGCFRNSIYSSAIDVKKYLQLPFVKQVKGKVIKYDSKSSSVEVSVDGNLEKFSGFSKIYLSAGCPNTTEIVMRSTGVHEAENMRDNAVYVFPILYFGGGAMKNYNEDYIAINNLIMALAPKEEGLNYAHALIYTNFDYMWRYNFPDTLWNLSSWAVKYSRSRVFWSRLFVHGDDSQSYSIKLEDDALKLDYASYANKEIMPGMLKSIRNSINKKGFYVPPISPILQKTNSHYSSTIPYNGKIFNLPENAEIEPNVFVCDSSVFPDLPAVSLTFTIMANAMRIATESVA